MRVALCQIPVSSAPEVNLGRVRAAAGEAARQGARLAVFPEGTQVRFSADLRAAAEPLDGPFCRELADIAASAGVALTAGVFEPAPDGRVFNTVVGFESDGRLAATYRKLHLFDALGYRESRTVAPGGTEPVIARLAGLLVGFVTCYDVRFPELARSLAAGGAQLLVVPAAWAAGRYKEEHWVTLVRARAIENTVWVAAAGQVPDPAEPGTRAPTGVGRSMLVDPMGVVRLDLGPDEAVAAGDVDAGYTDVVRAGLPSLANRREDMFPMRQPGTTRVPAGPGRGLVEKHASGDGPGAEGAQWRLPGSSPACGVASPAGSARTARRGSWPSRAAISCMPRSPARGHSGP